MINDLLIFKTKSYKKNNTISNYDTNKSTPISTIKQKGSINVKNEFFAMIQGNLANRYNTTPEKYDRILLENFVQSKYCHDIAVFKETILFYFDDEFLKRYYNITESRERVPKFVHYYHNYLLFFCNPTFSELTMNEIIQKKGEKKAQLFYNEKYKEESVHKEEDKENNVIFTSAIRKSIANMTNVSINLDETLYSFKEDKKELTSVNNSTLMDIMTDLSYNKTLAKAKRKKNFGYNGKLNIKLLYDNYNSVFKKKHVKDNMTSTRISSLTDRKYFIDSTRNKTIINSSLNSNRKKVLKIRSRNNDNINHNTISNTKRLVSLSKGIYKTNNDNEYQTKFRLHLKNTYSTQLNKKGGSKSKEKCKIPIVNKNTSAHKKSHVVIKSTVGDLFKTVETPKITSNRLKLPIPTKTKLKLKLNFNSNKIRSISKK